MAWNLKGPSATSFKSDRASRPTGFITYLFFSNLIFYSHAKNDNLFVNKTNTYMLRVFACMHDSYNALKLKQIKKLDVASMRDKQLLTQEFFKN